MPARAQATSLVAAALLAIGAGGAWSAAAEGPAAIEAPSGAAAPRVLCARAAGPVALGSAQWNGWGRGADNSRYQPEPAIRATDVPKLALKWAFGYPAGPVVGQPTIVDGRVFTVSAAGRLYALDAGSGCTYWTFDTQSGALSPVSIAELAASRTVAKPKRARRGRTDAHLEVLKAPSAALFGDDRGAVYAVDAERGSLLWKAQIESLPGARILAAPTVHQNRIFVAVGSSEAGAAHDPAHACCTFRGSVAALDLATGRVLWKTYLVSEEAHPLESAAGVRGFGPAGAAVEGAPTLDVARGLVYVATGDSFNPSDQPLADAVVALDIQDGQVRWAKRLPASTPGAPSDFRSAPILRTLANGRQALLVGQRSGTVYSLDPERGGEILWQLGAADAASAGAVEWGPAADHHSLYVALSGLADGADDAPGSLTAIDIRTGAKRWQTAAPTPPCSWQSAPPCSHGEAQAVTVIPGAAFSGSMDGHLRAYSTIDGRILWDYDTARSFTTVNQVPASGGSLDQGGATIVNGVVYVNSGSASGKSGNVLLAFSIGGK